MNITTVYNIGDLVQQKFQAYKSHLYFEVIDTQTSTCTAGTQVFYVVRPLIGQRDFLKGERQITDFLPGGHDRQEYNKYREDELKPCSEWLLDIVDKINKEE